MNEISGYEISEAAFSKVNCRLPFMTPEMKQSKISVNILIVTKLLLVDNSSVANFIYIHVEI